MSIEQYKLNSLDEYIIHKKEVNTLKLWLDDINNNTTKKYIILTGPSGCGKTLLVNLLFKKYQYDLIDFVPTHQQTHKNEIKRLYQLLTAKNILSMIGSYKKAILFDDIEVSNNNDRGYLNDVLGLLEDINKRKVFSNPAIFTISGTLKLKKIQALEKYAILINLNVPNTYESFQVAKYISIKQNISLDDYKLQFLANNIQGDIRKIYQAFNIYSKSIEVKNNNNEKYKQDLDIDTSNWDITYKKDLEFSPISSMESYLNPNNNADIGIYQKIYESEPIFTSANIYDNSWNILKNINFSNTSERTEVYEKILNSTCNWCILDNYYTDHNFNICSEYRSCSGIAKPMMTLRHYRNKYGYKHVNIKTSNLFSRISQSNFNWKSISELSDRLDISRNQYHQCSYIIAKLISNKKIDLHKLGVFLLNHNIIACDLDRIIRYNCISDILEKEIATKRKTIVRKILNGKNKK